MEIKSWKKRLLITLYEISALQTNSSSISFLCKMKHIKDIYQLQWLSTLHIVIINKQWLEGVITICGSAILKEDKMDSVPFPKDEKAPPPFLENRGFCFHILQRAWEKLEPSCLCKLDSHFRNAAILRFLKCRNESQI